MIHWHHRKHFWWSKRRSSKEICDFVAVRIFTVVNYWGKLTMVPIGCVGAWYDWFEAWNPTLPSLMTCPEHHNQYHMAVFEIRFSTCFTAFHNIASLQSTGEWNLEICHVAFTFRRSSVFLWWMLVPRSFWERYTGLSMLQSDQGSILLMIYKGNCLTRFCNA